MENFAASNPESKSTQQNGKTQSPTKTVEITPPGDGRVLDTFTVVKRNGMLVPFRKDRILRAIEAAFRATNEIKATEPLPQEMHATVHDISEEVVRESVKLAVGGACLTVEGIQDLVEVKLMQGGHYEVARRYIIYRDEQKAVREDSPRNLKVLRRDGKTAVRFNPMKIASAIERGFPRHPQD